MKIVYDAIKKFILTDMENPLKEMETKEGEFPLPDAKNIIYGTADLTRNEAKILVAGVPDSVKEDTGSLDSGVIEGNVVICFAFRGLAYSTLMERMETYAAAFRMALRSNPSLSGAVMNVDLGTTEYFPDAGATHGTMTVAEVEVTVRVTEKKAEGIDPFSDF